MAGVGLWCDPLVSTAGNLPALNIVAPIPPNLILSAASVATLRKVCAKQGMKGAAARANRAVCCASRSWSNWHSAPKIPVLARRQQWGAEINKLVITTPGIFL